MTTSEDKPEVIETPAADAPAAKARSKPRKLSTTDKLLELRASAEARVLRLQARSDRLWLEYETVGKELTAARLELDRLDATLPQPADVTTSQRRNVTNGQGDAEVFEVDPA